MATATNTLTQRSAANPGSVRSVSGFTRPDDTNAYADNDVIYESTGTAGVMKFDSCGVAGTIIHVGISMADIKAVDLDLIVFDQEPTGQADNATIAVGSADINKLVGVFSLTNSNKKLGAAGLALYEAADGRAMCYTSDNGSLYGVIVARDAFTPTAECAFSAFLHLQIDDV